MDLIQALLPMANQILVKTIRFWETIYMITIKREYFQEQCKISFNIETKFSII